MMNSGAIVATAGSISTASTVIISTCRPRNCIRENTYAAKTPMNTEKNDVDRAIMRLLKASCRNDTG